MKSNIRALFFFFKKALINILYNSPLKNIQWFVNIFTVMSSLPQSILGHFHYPKRQYHNHWESFFFAPKPLTLDKHSFIFCPSVFACTL